MTTINVPDSLKMLRETLCIAQAGVIDRVYDLDRKREHLDRIDRMIKDIDRQRPLGTNGKHGNLHTDTCGCEDK